MKEKGLCDRMTVDCLRLLADIVKHIYADHIGEMFEKVHFKITLNNDGQMI